MTPQALVVLEQRVRPDARETLDYFASQGVSVKVISGDNAVSVGAVAASLGLSGGGSAVDGRTLEASTDLGSAELQFDVGSNSIEARYGSHVLINDNRLELTGPASTTVAEVELLARP